MLIIILSLSNKDTTAKTELQLKSQPIFHTRHYNERPKPKSKNVHVLYWQILSQAVEALLGNVAQRSR